MYVLYNALRCPDLRVVVSALVVRIRLGLLGGGVSGIVRVSAPRIVVRLPLLRMVVAGVVVVLSLSCIHREVAGSLGRIRRSELRTVGRGSTHEGRRGGTQRSLQVVTLHSGIEHNANSKKEKWNASLTLSLMSLLSRTSLGKSLPIICCCCCC